MQGEKEKECLGGRLPLNAGPLTVLHLYFPSQKFLYHTLLGSFASLGWGGESFLGGRSLLLYGCDGLPFSDF